MQALCSGMYILYDFSEHDKQSVFVGPSQS